MNFATTTVSVSLLDDLTYIFNFHLLAAYLRSKLSTVYWRSRRKTASSNRGKIHPSAFHHRTEYSVHHDISIVRLNQHYRCHCISSLRPSVCTVDDFTDLVTSKVSQTKTIGAKPNVKPPGPYVPLERLFRWLKFRF